VLQNAFIFSVLSDSLRPFSRWHHHAESRRTN
jgi:hypothetical protein